LRKSAIADLRWLASLAPQGGGLKGEAAQRVRGKALAALRSAIARTLDGAARRIEKFNDRIRGGVGPLEWRGMAGATRAGRRHRGCGH